MSKKDKETKKVKKSGNKVKSDTKLKKNVRSLKNETKKRTIKQNKKDQSKENKSAKTSDKNSKKILTNTELYFLSNITNVKKVNMIKPKDKNEKQYVELILNNPSNYKILIDKSGIKKLIDYDVICIYVNDNRVIVNYKNGSNTKQLKDKLSRIIMNMKNSDKKIVKLIKQPTKTKQDLRKSNLKIVTQSENVFLYNLQNKKHPGIVYNKRRDKYEVTISSNGIKKHIGYFNNMTDAQKARREAEWKYYKNIIKIFLPEKVKLYK